MTFADCITIVSALGAAYVAILWVADVWFEVDGEIARHV